MGITFCTLAFFDMKIPDEETMISNGYSYSNELINGIIKRMINENASERPTSQQIYNTFIKYYVEKYVYNTGLYSCILSLFSKNCARRASHTRRYGKIDEWRNCRRRWRNHQYARVRPLPPVHS